MATWQAVVNSLSKLESKDWITLTASISALIFSILSFRQKAGEARLALRKQLTDLFEKLTALNTEAARFRAKKDDYPSNYLGLLNDQRRFLVRQAAFIARQVADLVNPYEYLVMAGAYDDINDWTQAEHCFGLAVSTSNQLDRGIAERGYGRYFFNHGRLDEAREQFSKAVQCFQGNSDRLRSYRADTYERWAGHEREWSGPEEGNRLLEQAVAEYETLTNPYRRASEVQRVRALIAPPKTKTDQSQNLGTKEGKN